MGMYAENGGSADWTEVQYKRSANVRFGSKADICNAKRHVRFTPESGHVRCKEGCPLSARSGHSARHLPCPRLPQ